MKTALVAALAIANAVVLLAGLAVAWVRPAGGQEAAFTIHKVDSTSFWHPTRDQPFFVLLIGNDGRPGLEGIRGDGLHVLGINPAARSATILNIPRDTWVPIPGHGQEKITMAHYYGGVPLQAQTVAAHTGLPISFVVSTDFVGFKALVEEMGGLHVNVPYRMFDRFSGADFQAGRVHMMGEGALSFARNRHIPNGDIARTEHQGLLLLGALERAREIEQSPLSTVRLLGMIARHTRYEGVSLRELYSLVSLGLSIDPANVRNVTIPSRVGKVGRADVVFTTPAAVPLLADLRDDAVLQAH